MQWIEARGVTELSQIKVWSAIYLDKEVFKLIRWALGNESDQLFAFIALLTLENVMNIVDRTAKVIKQINWLLRKLSFRLVNILKLKLISIWGLG